MAKKFFLIYKGVLSLSCTSASLIDSRVAFIILSMVEIWRHATWQHTYAFHELSFWAKTKEQLPENVLTVTFFNELNMYRRMTILVIWNSYICTAVNAQTRLPLSRDKHELLYISARVICRLRRQLIHRSIIRSWRISRHAKRWNLWRKVKRLLRKRL